MLRSGMKTLKIEVGVEGHSVLKKRRFLRAFSGYGLRSLREMALPYSRRFLRGSRLFVGVLVQGCKHFSSTKEWRAGDRHS